MKISAKYCIGLIITGILVFSACKRTKVPSKVLGDSRTVDEVFAGNLSLDNLYDYENLNTPKHIKQNINRHTVKNKAAMLGRVLFYDKKLSVSNTVSCGSCHKQENAFGLAEKGAEGVNSKTNVQSMRLINLRYSATSQFFWDSRISNITEAVTSPIFNHGEMGYSGIHGGANANDLVKKLGYAGYMQELFKYTYGTPEVTLARMQDALASFVFSLESFDSKYDKERAKINSTQKSANTQNYAGLTAQENSGKDLFFSQGVFNPAGKRVGGGVACVDCHFDGEVAFMNEQKNPTKPSRYSGVFNNSTPLTGNNGITTRIDGSNSSSVSKRSPSLRDLVSQSGVPNTVFFSNASAKTLDDVIEHYKDVKDVKPSFTMDERLVHNKFTKDYDITDAEKESLVAFLKTMSGSNIYTNVKWSDPFVK